MVDWSVVISCIKNNCLGKFYISIDPWICNCAAYIHNIRQKTKMESVKWNR